MDAYMHARVHTLAVRSISGGNGSLLTARTRTHLRTSQPINLTGDWLDRLVRSTIHVNVSASKWGSRDDLVLCNYPKEK